VIILFFPLHVTAESFHTKKQIKNISNSVVKIFNVSASPNFYIPWQTLAQKHSTGTGVIIDHNLILTAAHVVNDTVFLEVKKESSVDKYIAKVKWISHETDLALLEVKDNTFFDNTEASHLGAVPSRQEGVVVYGYPTGGNEISLTQGIVSRIELTSYAHSEESFLALQIDAAINPGNSGGPVFNKEGEIVGIAMQKMTGVENIGYIVPPPIIEHFFEDIEDGTYDGYANDGLYVQPIQNDYLKSYYGVEDKKKCHFFNSEIFQLILIQRNGFSIQRNILITIRPSIIRF
jgi:S1-C subfamily serine protease